MKYERLKKLVTTFIAEADGKRKLACADAFRLAQEHGVGLSRIAKICNAGKIKITKCQLGCF